MNGIGRWLRRLFADEGEREPHLSKGSDRPGLAQPDKEFSFALYDPLAARPGNVLFLAVQHSHGPGDGLCGSTRRHRDGDGSGGQAPLYEDEEFSDEQSGVSRRIKRRWSPALAAAKILGFVQPAQQTNVRTVNLFSGMTKEQAKEAYGRMLEKE